MVFRREGLIAAVAMLIFASMPVLAEPFPGKGFPPDKGRPYGPGKGADMERAREASGERMREAPYPGRPVHDRLSPEERQQLRRDIDQHGRELYRGKQR